MLCHILASLSIGIFLLVLLAFFLRLRGQIVCLGKKVYFWHSTGPSGGSFVGLAISKFAIPAPFSYSRATFQEPCNKAVNVLNLLSDYSVKFDYV